jgi:arylsulfatase A-like enzyme
MQDYSMFEPNADGVPVDERQLLELPELVKKYNRGVLDLDEGVGDLVASLERTGQLENTIIIYTADQGIAMGHHGMEIKVAPYDDNIRVPMIVRLPGKASSGRVVEQPVNVIDLIPTLFDYTGVDLPWSMSGDNLRPLIEDQNARWDRPILQENFSMLFGPLTDVGVTQPNPNQNVDWWIFLRHGNFKYITTLIPDEIEELYHIPNDPRELKNLAFDPKYQETLEELRSMMKSELKRTRAGLVDNLPEPRQL